MASEWFYFKGTERIGPVSGADLKQLALKKHLNHEDHVWRAGMTVSVEAHKVQGLFDGLPSQTADVVTGQATARQQPPPFSSPRPSVPPEDQGLPSATHSPTGFAGELANRAKAAATSQEAKAFGASVATAATAGAQHVQQGAMLASAMMSKGVGRLRSSFGAAAAETFRTATQALGTIIRRPWVLTFYAVVFLISSSLALSGIITAILFPMFSMGYLAVMTDLLHKRSANLGAFIGFMRHGWSTLWHLFMMQASFIVITSIALAPLLLFTGAAYLVGGTASSAYRLISGGSTAERGTGSPIFEAMAARQFLRDIQSEVTNDANRQRISVWIQEIDAAIVELQKEKQQEGREGAKEQRERADKILEAQAIREEERRKNAFPFAQSGYDAWKDGTFQSWAKGQSASNGSGESLFSSLWSTITEFLFRVILLLVFALLLFPICIVSIIFFNLILRVSTAEPTTSTGFDLVYDALNQTLHFARQRWKELATNSLFVPTMFVGSLFVQGLLATLLESLGLVTISRWMLLCVFPLYWFAFVIYVTVFLALVSLRSSDEVPVATPAAGA